MKYIKPSIKLNDYVVDESIAAYAGKDLAISGIELDYGDIDNEVW